MSGTSSPGPAPDALELAALLCSRVCHDLISPVGAIVNGLEVLDDNPKPEDRDFALDLIRKSAEDRFGAAAVLPARVRRRPVPPARRSISATPRPWRSGHIEDGKITLTWNLPRLLLPKNRVKLLLNMLVIAQQTIPRGGTPDDRSGRRGRGHELPHHVRRPQCPRAAEHRRSAQAGPRRTRSMRMRCSRITRGCWRRPAG